MPTEPNGENRQHVPTLSFTVNDPKPEPLPADESSTGSTPPLSRRSSTSTSISSDGEPVFPDADTRITIERNLAAENNTQINLQKQPSDWRFPYSAITGSGVNVVRVRRTKKAGHGYTHWQSMIPFSGTSKVYFEAVASRLEELTFNTSTQQDNTSLRHEYLQTALDVLKIPNIYSSEGGNLRGTMRHKYKDVIKSALADKGILIPDDQPDLYPKFEAWLKTNLRMQYNRRGSYATSRTSWNAFNRGDRTMGEWFDIRGNHELNEVVDILRTALLYDNSKLVTSSDNNYNLIANDGKTVLLSIVDDPDTLLVSITIPSDLSPDLLFQAIQIRADMNASHRQGTTSNTVGIFFGSNPLEYIEDVVAHLGHGFHIENFAEESKKARDALQCSTYSDDQIKAALARLDIASKYAAVFSISTPKKLQKGTKMKIKQVREAIKNKLTHATEGYFAIINATPPQSTPSGPTVVASATP